MKTIGGEIEITDNGLHRRITDSGRSSLRLIIQSLPEKSKYLLPDFVCSSVINVFRKMNSDFSFYKINEDLSIDFKSVGKRRFDVFYALNYFGYRNDCPELISRNKILLEDSVFLPGLEKPECAAGWIAFNSFRKISRLSDGSMISSTLKLKEKLIKKEAAPFSEIKYRAKNIKYEYLHSGKYSEKAYLKLFAEGEKKLDAQKAIYGISDESFFNLLDFYKNLNDECAARKKNFEILNRELKAFRIKISPEFPSFFPLKVNRRDELRKYLFSKNVFLPVHWPDTEKLGNSLYGKIISIPLDSRYGIEDMRRTADLIKGFYHKS